MKKNTQAGFALAYVLTALALVAVAAIGAYLISANKDSAKESTRQSKTADQSAATHTYTDTTKLYSVEYPGSWKATEAADCCEEEVDPSKVSKQVTFAPTQKANIHAYGLTISAGATDVVAQSVRQNWTDNKHTPETKTINGYEAQYVKVAFNGDAENYIDHIYLISHEGMSVHVTYREKYYHQSPAENWSAAGDMAEFQAILDSVRFLN